MLTWESPPWAHFMCGLRLKKPGGEDSWPWGGRWNFSEADAQWSLKWAGERVTHLKDKAEEGPGWSRETFRMRWIGYTWERREGLGFCCNSEKVLASPMRSTVQSSPMRRPFSVLSYGLGSAKKSMALTQMPVRSHCTGRLLANCPPPADSSSLLKGGLSYIPPMATAQTTGVPLHWDQKYQMDLSHCWPILQFLSISFPPLSWLLHILISHLK